LTLATGFDIVIFSPDQVEARDLDQLVNGILWDTPLEVDEQTTLYCARASDLSSAELVDDSTKVYMVGGLYEIDTDQGL